MGLACAQVFFWKVSLYACPSMELFLVPTAPPSLRVFFTAIDWAGGSAISAPAGSKPHFPAAFQLIKEGLEPLGFQNACCILLIDRESVRTTEAFILPSSTISIPKWKTSLVLLPKYLWNSWGQRTRAANEIKGLHPDSSQEGLGHVSAFCLAWNKGFSFFREI